VAVLVAAVAVIVAGCGRIEPLPTPSPAPPGPGASISPSEASTEPSTASPERLDPLPTAGALPDATASPCAGAPGADRVIEALRRDRNLLPPGATPKVVTGPLCAGSWQYTIMNVAGREALQVVTRDSGGALTVVTAGTYVCVPEVMGAAPAGIVAAAHCR
jgi:hypothetical protein